MALLFVDVKWKIDDGRESAHRAVMPDGRVVCAFFDGSWGVRPSPEMLAMLPSSKGGRFERTQERARFEVWEAWLNTYEAEGERVNAMLDHAHGVGQMEGLKHGLKHGREDAQAEHRAALIRTVVGQQWAVAIALIDGAQAMLNLGYLRSDACFLDDRHAVVDDGSALSRMVLVEHGGWVLEPTPRVRAFAALPCAVDVVDGGGA